jgi:hypothetical protein
MGAATAAIGAARTRAQNLMNKIRGGAADVASGITGRAQALIDQAQGIADAIQPKIGDLVGRIDALSGRVRGSASQMEVQAQGIADAIQPKIGGILGRINSLLGRSRGNQSPSQIDNSVSPMEQVETTDAEQLPDVQNSMRYRRAPKKEIAVARKRVNDIEAKQQELSATANEWYDLEKEKRQILRDLYNKYNQTPEYVVPDNPSTGEDVAQINTKVMSELLNEIPNFESAYTLQQYLASVYAAQKFAPYLQTLSKDQQMGLIDADVYKNGSEQNQEMYTFIDESLKSRISENPENAQSPEFQDYQERALKRTSRELTDHVSSSVMGYLMKFGHPDVRAELVKRARNGEAPFVFPVENISSNQYRDAIDDYTFDVSSRRGRIIADVPWKDARDGAGVDLMVYEATTQKNENFPQQDEFSAYHKFIDDIMVDHALAQYRLTTAHIQQLFTQIGPAQKMDGVSPNFFPPGITPPAPNAQAVKWMQQFYAEQQGRFMIDGVDSIQLHRGTTVKLGLPMESWSTDFNVGQDFSRVFGSGDLYSIDMPVDYIWGTYLSVFNWPENEVRGKEEHIVMGWPLVNGEDGENVEKFVDRQQEYIDRFKEARYQATGEIDIHQNFDDYDIYSRWYENSDDNNDDDKLTDIVARAKALSVSNLDKQSLLFDRIRQLSNRK